MTRCPWRVHLAAEPDLFEPARCALAAGHSPSIAHDTGIIDHFGDTLHVRWHTSNHVQPAAPTAAEREAYLRGQLHGYERQGAAAARAREWRRELAGYAIAAAWCLLAIIGGRRIRR